MKEQMMKSMKAILATSLLFLSYGMSGAAVADNAVGSAILGGTPYALKNYGTNVVKGRATLVSNGRDDGAIVIVKITGLKPGTSHIGHIHGGTCAALKPGEIFHNLKPVVADESGKGMSKTAISRGLQGLADCEWWVAFHEGAENTTPQSPALAVGPVIIKGDSSD
ncbi:MAG: hypothetical protein ACYC4K_07155 [Thiobacillus sp.]